MKKLLTTVLMLFLCSGLYAEYPQGSIENIDGSILGWSDSEKVWRPVAVDSTGKLPISVSAEVDTSKIEGNIASISATVASTSELVASMSARLDSVTVAKSMTHRLVSVSDSSASAINGSIPEGMEDRMIVEIRAQNGQPFYLGFNSSVDDTNGRKVTGAIMLTVSHSQGIFVYQNTGNEIKLDVTEGWK